VARIGVIFLDRDFSDIPRWRCGVGGVDEEGRAVSGMWWLVGILHNVQLAVILEAQFILNGLSHYI
jgi:hypothetical protein